MISAQRQTHRSIEIMFLWGTNIERNMKVKFLRGTHVTGPGYVTADITQGSVLRVVAQLCLNLCNAMDCNPPGSTVHGDSPGRNTGVGCHALLPTQGWNPGLPHCRLILYQLSYFGLQLGKFIQLPCSETVRLKGAEAISVGKNKEICTQSIEGFIFDPVVILKHKNIIISTCNNNNNNQSTNHMPNSKYLMYNNASFNSLKKRR